ncbi:AraC family transcriptional regulator [Hoeflea marina]|uniref:AraC family transcriptional regulator n=1 Tax=Hoeflea marina TaxID=274592 RepID=A0A317PIE9_9HYPH|nr:AraC family transcriptional regulator [Hoeflea marina]PWV97169.1 AraC family transcriptional regulator [Hoeflea marina]
MAIVLTASDLIDLFLRGGTIGILLLVVVHLLNKPATGPIRLTGIAFCLTGIAEAIVHTPLLAQVAPLPLQLMLPLEQAHFICMWWFVRSLFDDRFEWRLPCFIPAAIATPIVLAAILLEGPAVFVLRGALVALNVVLLGLIVSDALRDRATDLVNERRAFRRALALSVPPFTLFVSIVSLLNMWAALNPVVCNIYAAIYFLMSLGFSYWLTSLKGGMFARSETGQEGTPEDAPLTGADRLELDRVVKAMDGGLYLEPGLTIGGLGDLMHIPEHRLRRLINRGLGYRNFAAFVNDYRINEAKRRLADPAMAREQIIQHAFSLGYASLAPFNRAFRERVGVSPSEFREGALNRTAAE